MAKKIPAFTYTGSATTASDNTYWYIYLKTSGKLIMDLNKKVDVFAVGAGGGGSGSLQKESQVTGGAGGGGYTKTSKNISISAKTGYNIVIGSGGSGCRQMNTSGSKGGTTTAFGISAEGGDGGGAVDWQRGSVGGNGGCGGGGGASGSGTWGGKGGLDGKNGQSGSGYSGGRGQGTSTRAFGESTGKIYAGGGSAGNAVWAPENNPAPGEGGGGYGGGGGGQGYAGKNGGAGAVNTGGGGGSGGGGYYDQDYGDHRFGTTGGAGGNGGSGIVIIRGTQEDDIPVIFNGTKLMKLIFNGTEVKHLIYNGTTIYMRRLAEIVRKGRMKRHEICCD